MQKKAKFGIENFKKDVESVYIVSGDDGSEIRLEERATLSSTTRWRNKPNFTRVLGKSDREMRNLAKAKALSA